MAIKLIDTHSHINFKDYPFDPDQTWLDAKNAGIVKMLVVGCDLESSQSAVDFAARHNDVYAVVGIHPHNAAEFLENPKNKKIFEEILSNFSSKKIVAIGEFGLDYFYNNSPKEKQVELAHYQMKIATDLNLPLMLHIRSAFEDFWPIFDQYNNQTSTKGVVHCFTAGENELNQTIERGLHIALNGIITFTKDEKQLNVAKIAPLDKIILETDSPFLTPVPFRGKICKPEHTVLTAEFLAKIRGEDLRVVSEATTKNAINLFNLR